jgi:hypothetical protein
VMRLGLLQPLGASSIVLGVLVCVCGGEMGSESISPQPPPPRPRLWPDVFGSGWALMPLISFSCPPKAVSDLRSRHPASYAWWYKIREMHQ